MGFGVRSKLSESVIDWAEEGKVRSRAMKGKSGRLREIGERRETKRDKKRNQRAESTMSAKSRKPGCSKCSIKP